MTSEQNLTHPQADSPSPAWWNLILRLMQTMVALLGEVQALKTKLAAFEKDSTNSHKPPSSDGFNKKRGARQRGSSGRKPGGQKGHPGKTRLRVAPSEVAKTIPYKPENCEKCGTRFSEKNESVPVEHRQVLEIPDIKPYVIDNVFFKTICRCGHQTRLPVPQWMYSGIGENLQTHITYFTAEAKLSRRTTQAVLADVFKAPIALGTVQNRLEDTSEILKPVCDELENELPKQRVVNIDETSYPHNKDLDWVWAFVANIFVFFTIQASRGSKVIKKVLGERFDGIIICDRFSAYIKYQKDRACGLVQFCWAHIIRDIKALKNELAFESNQVFSVIMRKRIGAVFRLWYAHKYGKISRARLIEAADPRIGEIRAFLEKNQKASSKGIAKFCTQLLKRWNSLFTFIYHEGVEPTNNLAERLIRPAVQTRKISYCTRSEKGQLLRARLLTVSQTCRMQKRNALEFYRNAIHAHRNKLPFPSLLMKYPEQEIKMAA